ncbi:DUF3053 family protein [Sodalis-like symbiont of Bactericera trigonica]|nr:DUF3053 family protein [Sodalis-like symbiont of Bactericera trigonica]
MEDARAALKQPEDLQKVYAHAYDKLLTGGPPGAESHAGHWRRFFTGGTAGQRGGFSRHADRAGPAQL